MNDKQKHTAALIDAVANYLNNCRPPVDATSSQAATVIGAFNELVKPLIEDLKASESHTP